MRTVVWTTAVLLMASGVRAEPFVDAVVASSVGTGGGGGSVDFVLGPPRGGGAFQGSQDTFSLGLGGSIVLEFTDNVIVNGPGADLTVFENAFLLMGLETALGQHEPGTVSVSADGVDWHTFPCALDDAPYHPGCAGMYPVFANADDPGAPSPLTPTLVPLADLVGVPVADFMPPPGSGGDSFDLAVVGLAAARFVRIVGGQERVGLSGLSGFDLDAVAAVHSVDVAGAPDTDGDGFPDAADGCPSVADPQQLDTDGDGIGDACEDTSGCDTLGSAQLKLERLAAPAGDENLALAGTLALPAGALIDPLATGIRVQVADTAGTVVDALLPPGAYLKATKVGWKRKGAAWTFKHGAGGVQGITAAKMKQLADGVSIKATGKRGSYAVTPGALPLVATVVVDGAAGRCGATAFAADGCVANTAKGKIVCR